MAPGEPNQKRTRGRPPGASRVAEGATERAPKDVPTREPAGAAPDAAPKKRGRPRKSVVEAEDIPTNQSHQPEPTEMAPKKRGRPPKARGPEPEEDSLTEIRPRKRRRGVEAEEEASLEAADLEKQNTEETTSRRRRRNRQPDESPAQPSPSEPAANTGQAGNAKGRPGRKPAARDEQPAESPTTEDTPPRRSRRERRSADDKPWWTGSQQSPAAAGMSREAPGPHKPKRGRPSLAEVAISQAQNQAGPSQAEPKQQKRGRGRSPRTSNEADSPKEAAGKRPQKAPPQTRPSRRLSSETEPAPDAAPDPLANHRHLTTLTRQIPRATITSKWTPLDTPSITAISSLLTDSTLPVLHRLRDRDARHAQAQSILRIFSARLRSKLTKGMPFPPPSIPAARPRGRGARKGGGAAAGSHELELDFEKTVDAIAGLEKALDPLLHSAVLLRGEKEREERALEREYEVLRRLEGNARAQVRGWREGPGGRGREHVLVGEIGGGGKDWEREGGLGEVVVKGEGGGEPVFKDLQEEELLALSQQIGNHMESMRSNLGQIEGVVPAIAKSKAALQGALCEHLDPDQYEQVLLG